MADRELKVVISKKSEQQIQKAIEKIDETNATVKRLKIEKKMVDGVSVPVLKILVTV